MASVSMVTLTEVIIPIVPAFCPKDIRTAKVENRWQTGTDLASMVDHCSKMFLPVCDNTSNKELFLCIVDQFLNAAHDDHLHLDNGGDHCTKFRCILGGDLCIVWQGISDAQATKMVDNFMLNIDALVVLCLQPMANFDQIAHVCASTKPHCQSCEELTSCLRIMSHLG